VPAVEKAANSQKRADALTAITEHFIASQKWIFKTADGEIIEPNPTLPAAGPTMGVGGFMAVPVYK
jgi:hypothetical protein